MGNKSVKKRLVIAILLVIIMIAFWVSGAYKFLSFDDLKKNAAWLKQQAECNLWKTIVGYCGMYVGVVLCSLPGVSLINIVGGFLFGLIFGVFWIVVAATSGALLFFLIIRYIIGDVIHLRYAHRLIAFNRKVDQKGWLYLLLLRFIPVVPFFMVNMLAALTKIRLSTFVWTTAVGVLPSAIVFAYVGTQFMHIQSVADIFSFSVLLAFAGLLLLMLIPLVISRYLKII